MTLQNYNSYPLSLCLAISFRCNFACRQCGQRLAIKQNERKKECLTPKTLKAFLKGKPRLMSTTITGGEPTFHKNLEKITKAVIESVNTEYLVTITNGSNPSKLGRFIDIALDSEITNLFIGVSIDGIGETCDEIRAKGSYEHAINALELINERQEGDARIVPSVSFTIMPNNYMEILSVFYLSLSYRAAFNYRIARPFEQFVLNEEMLKEVDRQQHTIISMMDKTKNVVVKPHVSSAVDFNIRYIEGIIPHYKTGKRTHPCQAPLLNMNVDPYGDLYPCNDAAWMTGRYGNNVYKIGNIKDGTLKDFISSEQRKEVIGLFGNCHRCWDECSYHTIAPEYLEGLKIFRP